MQSELDSISVLTDMSDFALQSSSSGKKTNKAVLSLLTEKTKKAITHFYFCTVPSLQRIDSQTLSSAPFEYGDFVLVELLCLK